MGARKTESLDHNTTVWPFPGTIPGSYPAGTPPLTEGQIKLPDEITPDGRPEVPVGNIQNETPGGGQNSLPA